MSSDPVAASRAARKITDKELLRQLALFGRFSEVRREALFQLDESALWKKQHRKIPIPVFGGALSVISAIRTYCGESCSMIRISQFWRLLKFNEKSYLVKNPDHRKYTYPAEKPISIFSAGCSIRIQINI